MRNPPVNSKADVAIQFALDQVGKPYLWGATGPNAYDCSGLIQASYENAGINLSRTTYTQVHEGTAVSPNQASLMPGDLVFPDAGHVQLYIGNGTVVESPHSGANVRVVPLRGIWAARRVTTPGSPVDGSQTSVGPVNSVTQAGVFDWAQAVSDGIDKLLDAYFWLRVGEIVGGVVLIIIGILGMSKVQKALGAGAKVAAVV